MLLTEAARHALPSVFTSSSHAIANSEGHNIYVGLQGWGYELQDPSREVRAEPVDPTTIAKEFKGWLGPLVGEYPELSQELVRLSILDDKTYLANEAELDRSTRQELGSYRLRALVPQNCEDPCEIARAAPPWLLEREIKSLELPVRASNVFKLCNIRTVRDLSMWTAEQLLEQQNFGRKSAKDAIIALRAALSEGPVGVFNGQDLSHSQRLLVEVRRTLLSFPERERDVLSRRLGYERPPQTLQEVAADYKVTRERIRQIEARSMNKWTRESFWDDVLVDKLDRLLTNRRQTPLPVVGIEGADPWFEGIAEQPTFFKNLVQEVCGGRISVIEVSGIHYLSKMTLDVWDKTRAAAQDLLASGVGHDWGEAYAKSLVEGLLPDNAKEFATLLWDGVSSLCHFSANADGSRTLVSFGRGAEQAVEAILAESARPLHYSEITEVVRPKLHRDIDIRRVHSAAATVGLLFSPGTYGLTKHIPLSEMQMAAVRSEAEEIILSEAPGRQWHCYEILQILMERLNEEYVGLNKYVLNIALRASHRLKSLHRMTWVAKEASQSDDVRIDIQQAIVSFVKSAGRPLTANEIRKNLSETRGVNETFAITAGDPLIRIGDSLWGLNDRDIPITRDEQRILIDMLVEYMEDTQRGMYGDEVSEVLELKGCPPETFIAIARQDRRVRVSSGRCVYLAKWNDPRRETFAEAVENVLREAGGPLHLETITMLASRRLDRNCSRGQVSGSLQAIEAIYDEENRTWVSAGSRNETEDDEVVSLSDDAGSDSHLPTYSVQSSSAGYGSHVAQRDGGTVGQ